MDEREFITRTPREFHRWFSDPNTSPGDFRTEEEKKEDDDAKELEKQAWLNNPNNFGIRGEWCHPKGPYMSEEERAEEDSRSEVFFFLMPS